MAAGLGFKDFTTGEVLTAADVDGYLMQGIWVFASNAARDAAVTAPAEGNFAFTKDTNSLWYYDGAAWVASGATGDIEGVTAGVGISGGGTSGTVTVTNSMATAIDAKGDLVVGTGADTFSKLTVGANGTTLVADSAEATGLKWAAPAGGGGMTVLASGSLPTGGTNLDLTSISGSYNDLRLVLRGVTASGVLGLDYRVNGNTSGIYNRLVLTGQGTTVNTQSSSNSTTGLMTYNSFTNGGTPATWILDFPDYANTTSYKFVNVMGFYEKHDNTNIYESLRNFSGVQTTSAISSISYIQSGTNVTGGTYILYGIK